MVRSPHDVAPTLCCSTGVHTLGPAVANRITADRLFPDALPLLGVLLILAPVATAFAQAPAVAARGHQGLARYAPATTNLCITIRRLDEFDAAMRRAHGWHLLPLLTGGGEEGRIDLRRAIADYLGPASAIRVDDLMRTELGIVAPSLLDLGSAAWLVRIKDEGILDRWDPGGRARRGGSSSARFFATEGGLVACVKGDVAALARRTTGRSTFADTIMLMAGRRIPVLADDSLYRELIAYLPGKPLAVAYLRNGAILADGLSAATGGIGAALDRAVVGLYEGDGRLDVAVRASLKTPRHAPALSGEAIGRLVRLPLTTLAGAAVTMHFGTASGADGKAQSAISKRLGTLMAGLRGRNSRAPTPFPSIGPNFVLAWGQDLRAGLSAPQVAVMAQCADVRAVRSELNRIAANAIKLIDAVDPVAEQSPLKLRRAMYLGTPISYLPLKAYVRKSRFPIVRLLEHIEPAWASVGDWVVLALSKDHIERILDAHHGLMPTLVTVPDVEAIARRRVDRTAVAVIQADLAADVLRQWLSRQETGSPSLLNPAWWTPGGRAHSRRGSELGVTLRADAEGTVTVIRVEPGGATDGHLLPGDRILGADGQLLSLSDPDADLNRRWVQCPPGHVMILRVVRDRVGVDVKLEGMQPAGPATALPIDLIGAVREFASLGEKLRFASFTSFLAQEDRYNGRLTLRFNPAAEP